MLIPFDGTFESHRDPVPILIHKTSDQCDRTDVIQNWRYGNEFLFLDGKDDVAELVWRDIQGLGRVMSKQSQQRRSIL